MERCPHCNRPKSDVLVEIWKMSHCGRDAAADCMAIRELGAVEECEDARKGWLLSLLTEALPIVSHYEVAHEHNGLAKRIQAALERK